MRKRLRAILVPSRAAILDLVVVAGAAAIGLGVAAIYWPAGVITGGVLAVALGALEQDGSA